MSTMRVRDLSVLAYAQGVTQWSYRAPTMSVAAVSEPGYLASCVEMFEQGDPVVVICMDGTAHRWVDRRSATLLPLVP